MLTQSYSVASLKAHLSAVLAVVAKGQDVVVTDHNRVVARIVSASKIPPLPHCDLTKFFKETPIKLVKGASSSAALVRRMRDEEQH